VIRRLTLGYLGVVGAVLVGTMAYLLIVGRPVRVFIGPLWSSGLGMRAALLVGTLVVVGVTVWAASTVPADDVPARWGLPLGAAGGTLGILLVLIGGLAPASVQPDLTLTQMIVTGFGTLAIAFLVAARTRRSSAAVMAAVWYYLLASLGGIAGELTRGLLVGGAVMRPGAVTLRWWCDGQASGTATISCVLGSVLADFGIYLSLMILALALAVPVAAAGRGVKVAWAAAHDLQGQALRVTTVARVGVAGGAFAVALLLLVVASY
jgi:hypothetical protein